MKELVSADIYMLYIYKYIYRERERERERRTKVSACSAAPPFLLQRCSAAKIFLFCCSAAISNACDNYQCHLKRCLYYQIAAAQWLMVHFGTQRVGPIPTPNIGPNDEGLISISATESHPLSPVTRIKARAISYDGTTTK